MAGYLTTAAAAQRMNVSEETVRDLCKRGVLSGAIRKWEPGGPWQIPDAAIDAWLQQHTASQVASPTVQPPIVGGVPSQTPVSVVPGRPQPMPWYQPLWAKIGTVGLALAGVVTLLTLLTSIPADAVAFWGPIIAPHLPARRAFAPARSGETLIVVATFHHADGAKDTEAHHEIRHAIEAKAAELGMANLRVEVEPHVLQAGDQMGAKSLGTRYSAAIVIWGADTNARFTVNFLNLKQPNLDAADVEITESGAEGRTQLANPSAFAEFVTDEMPAQLTFLALFAIGQSYLNEADYESALATIESAVAALPSSIPTPEGVAEAYFWLGWLHQVPPQALSLAVNAYTEAIQLDPTFAFAYNNRGLAYRDQGRLEEAIVDLDRAIQLEQGYVDAYNNRGLAYHDLGRLEEALADYHRAILLDPENAIAYSNRGAVYSKQGELELALADYDRAIHLDPQSAVAYNNRGAAYRDQGEIERAIADINRAIELEPDLALPYNNRGTAYSDQGEFERAIADFNRAIELESSNALGYYNRGSAYLDLGELERAIADYDQAITLDPGFLLAYHQRSLAYYQQGEFERAIADSDQVILLDAAYARAYVVRASAYHEQGEWERAIADYDQMILLDPTNVAAYNDRGLAYYEWGEVERAIADYERAMQLAPDYAIAYYNRAMAYRAGGDLRAAIADFRHYLDLEPTAANRQQAEERLQELEVELDQE